MSEGITADELPFFMNPARLRREETYFAIGRSASEVRNFLEQRRLNSAEGEGSKKPQGELGYYGVQQFIQLDDVDGHEIEEPDSNEDLGGAGADEDTEYESTSTYSLFWMSMRKLATLLGCSNKRNILIENHRSNIDSDLESQTNSHHHSEIPDVIFASNSHANQTRRIHSDANLNYELDLGVRQDGVIIYRDRGYLIQKLRLDTGWGSFDVLMFSVALPKTDQPQECKTDLQYDLF
ncbi:unnamed protein product [Orchesella dallaii]|uniref:Uncharacterized protein n=1 Tax=Orchesella dallaii TaxID=48710 RepID=A0ABP1QQ77_9HEXA